MTWHSTGISQDDAGIHAIIVGDIEVVVISLDGQCWAIEDRCSHADCSFISDGEFDGHVAICDCHGSEFDVRTGAVLAMPATEPLRTFAVRAVSGHFEIEL